MQLPYLNGYPDSLKEQVRDLIRSERLGPLLAKRYPDRHQIQSDGALRDYVQGLKSRYLKSSSPLSKVVYDGKINIVRDALGLHTYVSRVQGSRLKSKNEIRIAALFKEAPPEFLEMIVVHELAHLKEKEHNKGFYQLCCHLCPNYHQWEFDLRLWLTWRDLTKE
ncbi:M48 family metallopeptidase [Aeromonas schubertii]|uniref:M48 family metallopeptidase n=1 Tax=Aeromonas schubertii TaxID=652 RepID=A0ABS7V926_9GAMM|nr:M48 family metallopeptidase [Aeromonas schubertii]KUE79115.1 metal-dependent hydrolase [Aeromonas schubertii]MBZ6065884.1 M48 family metallopeptidase [Aeromonas schubertii]MBZ6071950.1 M48 family metallopeptidase [Aeromonas schubertii]QCG48120.1 M48 family peptidase [Aeromonas schubertii]